MQIKRGYCFQIKCASKFLFWDEDNFIKSVRELGTEDIVASNGLTSCLAFFQVDFFSVRNLFLWKTKNISSLRERDFFCRRNGFLLWASALPCSLPLCASIKITASLRFLKIKKIICNQIWNSLGGKFWREKNLDFEWKFLAVAAAAFLSCLTACRRISPESEEKIKIELEIQDLKRQKW